MAESSRSGSITQSGIEQILLEAKHRWLRPAEICEILQNYQKFQISPEPPNKPPSGSLFLFDRKVLRYFRKDGHNWRKKKDGKIVNEAHERLKVGSVDVLHCYYAHGEENGNFQRRVYWMLEEDFMHIVFVHYLEVKGSRSSYTRPGDSEEAAQVSHMDSPGCSSSFTSQSQLPSQITGSPDSAQTSEHEDAESDNHQTRSRYNSFTELQHFEYGHMTNTSLVDSSVPVSSINNQYFHQRSKEAAPGFDLYSAAKENVEHVFDVTGIGLTSSGPRDIDITSWENVLEHCTTGFQSAPFQPFVASTQASALTDNYKQGNLTLDELFNDLQGVKKNDAIAQCATFWQLCNDDVGSFVPANLDQDTVLSLDSDINNPSPNKRQQPLNLSNLEDQLMKYDSFSKWMSKELDDVEGSYLNNSSGLYLTAAETEDIINSTVSGEDHLDTYLMSPSLAPEQLYSIIEVFPNWTYTNLETKVFITGTFLKNTVNVERTRWSCMFGEIEVPAEALADGNLCCYAPPRKSGRVPFYITCSDRLACSEVREFEFLDNHTRYMGTSDFSSLSEMNLHIRLEKLLSLESFDKLEPISNSISGNRHFNSKISTLMLEDHDGWYDTLKPFHEQDSTGLVKDRLLEKLLREKLHAWLIHKEAEDDKVPCALDEKGQGVIHLAAALGYDWAIKPTILAGVNINFRDASGWTALHWAAFCGRERTVVSLLSLDATPGALTDPSPEYPSGRTPADLASENGHKGIAGFLAESALTSQLSTLNLKNSANSNLSLAEASSAKGIKAIEDVTDRSGYQLANGDMHAGHSLEDSLNAVRNATQAASRIYQVFRVHSFCRKKQSEYSDGKCGMSDESALSLVSMKATRSGHDMPLHAAAIRIQNKFRGYKGRKDFLILRQRIVKIQAHVRGHQARKQYKKFVWSVGIVEKVVLRWRRKRSGLRGFCPEGLLEGPIKQSQLSNEDDYDFLKEGRKQTEARLEKALARVKSMVQYPEARDQYRRLLTVVTELQKSKDMQEKIMNETEDAADIDLMIEELMDDDTPMPTAIWL